MKHTRYSDRPSSYLVLNAFINSSALVSCFLLIDDVTEYKKEEGEEEEEEEESLFGPSPLTSDAF